MTTIKKVDVTHLGFVVGIVLLAINYYISLNIIDLVYLMFVIGSYFQLIYIRYEKKVSKS